MPRTGSIASNVGPAVSSASPVYPIPADGTPAQRSRKVAASKGKAVLPLTAAYHKTGAKLSHGTLASAVTVSITYN